MKHTRILTTLLFLLTVSFSANAQTDGKISGTFAPTETCKVSYTITPQATDNNMALELYVSQPCVLNVHIVNKEGKELIAISSGAVARRFGKDIDLSALSAGDYYVEFLYSESKQSHKVPFTKS